MDTYIDVCNAIKARGSQFVEKRNTWDPHYIDLRDNLLPFHGRALDDHSGQEQNNGKKRHHKIINGVATYAVNVLAAGMQSGLTSPARPWFRLGLPDKDLGEFGPVKEWLHSVEEAMRYVMAMSDLYNGLHHTYQELGAFGTGAMAVLEHFDTVVRGRPFTVGEYYLGTNEVQRVDTMYRLVFMTVGQIVSKFGIDNVSQPVKTAYNNHQTEQLRGIWHVVEPNDDRVELSAAQGRPWRSIYMERENPDSKILRASGFDEFPIVAPRWEVSGADVYGNGPGMNILGDTKMLQKMETKGLIALDKQVEPPVVAPGSMKDVEIHTVPGGVSYEGDVIGSQGMRSLYQVNANLQHLEAKMQNVQAAIKTGMYNDLFLMLAQMPTHQMTATEVAERHEEKLIMLGPVLERLHFELLDPIVDRVFAIMSRNDLIPPPPEEIQGADLKVEYVSLLAQAQKMVGLSGVEKLAAFAGNLAGAKPSVLDKVDFDEAVDIYADGLGVPPSLIVSDEDVKQVREARNQVEQQDKQSVQLAAAADGAKTLSEVDVGGGQNMIQQIMGAPTGNTPGAGPGEPQQ